MPNRDRPFSQRFLAGVCVGSVPGFDVVLGECFEFRYFGGAGGGGLFFGDSGATDVEYSGSDGEAACCEGGRIYRVGRWRAGCSG